MVDGLNQNQFQEVLLYNIQSGFVKTGGLCFVKHIN